MANILIFIFGLALCVQAFIGLTFFISSIQEKEKRATTLGGLQFLGMIVLVILFFALNSNNFFNSGVGFSIMVVLIIIGIIAGILFFSKIGTDPKILQGTKGLIVGEVKQCDERNVQFSKMMRVMYAMMKLGPPPGAPGPNGGLPPGAPPMPDGGAPPGPPGPPPGPDSSPFGKPLSELPPEVTEIAKTATDEEINAAGIGPLGPPPNAGVSEKDNKPNAAMTAAGAAMLQNWATPDKFSPPPVGERHNISPEEASIRIKGYMKNLGAVSVGITEIDKKWVYSHWGVSGAHLKNWGKEVILDHKYAIVFTEEMSFETVSSAPHSPSIIESMKNYAKGAFIGAQIANFIAYLGYSARANHAASYDCNLVPLAVDAGLGELSRMGYLITKEKGPRVRLSAVTTDLPLIPDKPVDIGVKHFCTLCKKCARCCPSRSIPDYDEPREANGSLRWKINDETCFDYWQKVGTDCAICMRVCPWSHDRTFPHKFIVEAVSRSKYSRVLFNWMDDLFYGSKPRAKSPPEWAKF